MPTNNSLTISERVDEFHPQLIPRMYKDETSSKTMTRAIVPEEKWCLQYAIWDLYATIVKFAFYIWNMFIPKIVVPPPKHPILLKTAGQLAREIREKKLTSTEVITTFIARIKEVNPIINAVCEDNYTEAIELAKRADELIEKANEEEIEKLSSEKPLFGVPYTIKDSMQLKGKKLTWGCWSMKDVVGVENAEVVDRMNNAGAILLCMTNVPELAFWIETSNVLYGTTRNPYDNRRSVGGSSGGEGAMITAAASVIGVGSDIGGSIRVPSAMNGVFGLKPTSGIVSTDRYNFPERIDEEMNNVLLAFGPLCRYMEDLKLGYRVMGGKAAEMALSSIDSFPVQNVYIVPDTRMDWVPTVDGEVKDAVYKVSNFLCREYGIQEHIHLDMTDVRSQVTELFCAQWSKNGKLPHPRELFFTVDGPYTMYSEFPKWLMGKSKHSLAGCCVDRLFQEDLTRESVEKYLSNLQQLQSKYNSLLSSNSFIVLPVWPHVAAFHHQEVCASQTLRHTATFNVLSLPALVCPLGLNKDGLPLSVMIVGPRGSDGRLIEIGHKLEKKYGGWVPPGINQ